MEHRAVILDGITVQHVGEVLFDAGVPRQMRRKCAASYRRSLEDFVFAVLFGERLTLSTRLPPVGDDEPGARLIHAPPLQDFLVGVDLDTPPTADELIAAAGLRDAVATDLEALGKLSKEDLAHFEDFYLREASAYLGDDPSILDPTCPPETYQFRTASRESHYVQSPELQQLVPTGFLTHMVSVIRNKGECGPVAEPALAEFVTRTQLTHYVNYWVFDYAIENQPHGSARLPHVTRATVRHIVDDQTASPAVMARRARLLKRLVYHGVVPHALLHVLGVTRDDSSFFLEALRAARDAKQFQEIRKYMTELVYKLGMGDRKDADKLLEEIARKSGQGGGENESYAITVPVVGGFELGGGILDRIKKRISPGKYYLRRLIRESPYVSESSYLERLRRIFPDLVPESDNEG